MVPMPNQTSRPRVSYKSDSYFQACPSPDTRRRSAYMGGRGLAPLGAIGVTEAPTYNQNGHHRHRTSLTMTSSSS
jgi:hypothetical protein